MIEVILQQLAVVKEVSNKAGSQVDEICMRLFGMTANDTADSPSEKLYQSAGNMLLKNVRFTASRSKASFTMRSEIRTLSMEGPNHIKIGDHMSTNHVYINQ